MDRRRARPAGGPGARVHDASPPRRAGEKRRAAPGVLRRPLQPGVALLPEPAARRAAAHHRRLHLRAVQGRAPRHPRADGRQPAQRRRGPGRRHRRRPRPGQGSRPGPSRRSPRTTTSTALAGAEHPRQRRPTRSPAASSGILVSDGAPAGDGQGAPGRRQGRRGDRRGHRPDHRRRGPRRRQRPSRPTRWSAAGRRCSTTRWPSCSARTVPPTLAAQPAAKDFVTDAHAHHKLIAHTAGGGRAPRRRRRGRARRRRLPRGRHRAQAPRPS